MKRAVCVALVASVHLALHAEESARELFAKGKVKGGCFYTSCGPEHLELLAENGFNCGVVKLGLSLSDPEGDSKALSSIARFGRAARQSGVFFLPCLNYAGHPETALLKQLGRAFVSAEGAALPKTPCPLCRDYWERAIAGRLAALAKAGGPGVFEDVTVSLGANLPPYLSESPERLLLPPGVR